MATETPPIRPGGLERFASWRVIGTPAPVFPGFEIDINDRVDDDHKPDAVWHRDRARQMLRAHPEMRELMRPNPWTAVWCVVMAGLQIALAAASASWPVWLIFTVAWVVGGMVNVCLFMLAHECMHGLVFRRTWINRVLYTLTSLPMFLSGHHTWWMEHNAHHNDLGATKDFVKRRRTFFLATRRLSPLIIPYSIFMIVTQFLRSALGLLVYAAGLLRGQWRPGKRALAILADEHLVSGYERHNIGPWAVLYPAGSLLMIAGLWAWGGWYPLLYLLLAQAFMTGFLHPLIFGMILSNSHFHGSKRYQPSSSYYGWLNKVSFNFGLHTEHHDIAAVPWNLLPRMRPMAPEFYDDLVITRSYVALAWQFLFGRAEDFEQQFDLEEHRNREMLAGAAEKTSDEISVGP